MPTFHYTAKRGPRDIVEGTIDAENRSGVLTYLADLGYVPVRVNEHAASAAEAVERPASVAPGHFRRVPAVGLAVLTRQFASLVRSAVPLLRALKILEEQAKHPLLRHVLHELAEAVRQGQTLSSAMAKFPSVFSPLYINLIHSGEVSGALDTILQQLAQQMEQEEAMRRRIRMAFVYPGFVACVGLLTVVFLMTFVMPRLARLLIGLGERLPAPTRLLLTLSGWMSSPWWWGLALGVILVVALLWKGSGERGRLVADRLILRAPLIGLIVQQSELARFARSLGLQLHHGIAILQAIETANSVVSHRVMRSQLQRLTEGLRQGTTLSTCLRDLSISTPFLVNTVAVGEESGKVSDALTEVAAYYEQEAERLLQTMATLLEPMLILGVGLVVGFIVMAVLLPIFEMSSVNL